MGLLGEDNMPFLNMLRQSNVAVQRNASFGEMSAYQNSPIEALSAYIQDSLIYMGQDPYSAGRLAEKLTFAQSPVRKTIAGLLAPSEEDQATLRNNRAIQEQMFMAGDYKGGIKHGIDDMTRIMGPEVFGAGVIKSVGKYMSRLNPAIEAMKQDKMTTAQAQGHFDKFPGGVGKDELEYTGIQNLLDQGQPVTKTQLLVQAQGNPLEITDIIKKQNAMDGPDYVVPEYLQDEARDSAIERAYNDYDVDEVGQEYMDDVVQSYYDEELADLPAEEFFETKFHEGSMSTDTVLHGGEDYSEMLLTLPTARTAVQKTGSIEAWKRNIDEAQGLINAFDGVDPKNMTSDIKKYIDLQRDIIRDANKQIDTISSQRTGENYNTGHYDEPNVLSHARYNTRTIDGDKTLFIEEIQSDWHQQGRKKGYKGDVKNHLIKKYQKYLDEQNLPQESADELLLNDQLTHEQRATIQHYSNQFDVGGTGGVPDAPFKKNWHDLTFRRMLKEASDQGHDRIAWTPGDIQADRYDLSKQIDHVIVERSDDGDFLIEPFKDGKSLGGSNVEEVNLSEHIGKDLADKIVKDFSDVKITPDDFGITPPKEYSGLDLKIGGEGMKGFYDKMLVKSANKFAKKFGQKVEVKKIITEPHGMRTYRMTDDGPVQAGDTEVWSMKLTPEMKKALAGGVALSGIGLLEANQSIGLFNSEL